MQNWQSGQNQNLVQTTSLPTSLSMFQADARKSKIDEDSSTRIGFYPTIQTMLYPKKFRRMSKNGASIRNVHIVMHTLSFSAYEGI